MRFGVVVFPGSNCERDCFHWVEQVAGRPALPIWHGQADLGGVDCVILPGGFSYGDYLRPGAIARLSPVMRAVQEHAAAGGLVLGICNGFQILLEAGLLPGAVLRNRSLKFECRDVFLRVEDGGTPFTRSCRPGQVIRLPIKHADGNYRTAAAGGDAPPRVLFRYCEADGRITAGANPNGAQDNIAGLANRRGNVVGLMPHPEVSAEPVLGGTDGRLLLTSALDHWKEQGEC
ncbi:MAG TPA: phosphoribosylformylglycinamidine synthase subunit PurQ [Bacillota bacterium]|nr:phosphoribosylformylglycinamidine synthase subunit PurQ [Bacillota bacterium]